MTAFHHAIPLISINTAGQENSKEEKKTPINQELTDQQPGGLALSSLSSRDLKDIDTESFLDKTFAYSFDR